MEKVSSAEMRVWEATSYGEGAQFTSATRPRPIVGTGQVLIEVKATSINPVDHKILTSDLGINPELPAILHMDVSGVVREVGAGVDQFQVGDPVYGCAGGLMGPEGNIDGALADFMLADANLLARKPERLSFAEAAALPLVSITAWEALFERAEVTADDHVLIHGATGGVGHVAIQLAKHRGARVATTASSEAKLRIGKDLGADDAINYREASVEEYVQQVTEGKGFSIVFDTVGGANLDDSMKAAAMHGDVVGIIGLSQHDLSPLHLKGLSLHLVFMLLPLLTGEGRRRHGKILAEVAALVDSGDLKPLVHEKRFRFSEVNDAHALYASGHYLGKIVLENR